MMKQVNKDESSHPGIPAILRQECELSGLQATQYELRYESAGCLLIIGNRELVFDIAQKLKHHLRVIALVGDTGSEDSIPEGIDCVQGKLIDLYGYLGNFVARISGKERTLNLALLCPGNKERFDLVLDLSKSPFLSMEVPPLGYFSPKGDRNALNRATTELWALKGVFRKPRFFSYSSSLCAHARHGINGCERCLEVCPTNAITDDGDKVHIDPYLCQGCGTCMLVCPSGAVYSNSELDDDPLEFICRELGSHPDPSQICVLLYDAQADHTFIEDSKLELGDRVIAIELRELATYGMEAWLTAFACGAGEVVLLSGEHVSQRTLKALKQQMNHIGNVLAAVGHDPKRLRLISSPEGVDFAELANFESGSRLEGEENFNRLNGKRKNIEKAIKRLVSSGPRPCVDEVQLGTKALFGGLSIDKNKCTLCMGCVKPCPTSAMRRAGDISDPKLGFVEGLCVQCGICATACPEQAIELIPRLILDQQMRKEVQVLNESPPFRCISCGKPFTTSAIVELMSERLKDNPFFQGDGLKKLKQCPDCRAHYDFLDQLESLNRCSED